MDSLEDTQKIAADLGYPVAYGMTRAHAEQIGAWWEPRRDHIQPSEFLLRGDGRVFSSTYSSSPIGRMDPEETLTLMNMIAKR